MTRKKECPRFIPREKEPGPEAASELSDGLGELIDRLEKIWEDYDRAVDWGQECMGYALQPWEWKYGDDWREEESAATRGKAELKDIITELRRVIA